MDEKTEVDPWVIPLHGAELPTSSADAGPTPPQLSPLGPGAELGGTIPLDDGILAEVGFHPRLRRSA